VTKRRIYWHAGTYMRAVLQSAMPSDVSICGMRCQPSLPISERLASGVLALPIYNDMTADDATALSRRSAFSGNPQ